VFRGDQLAYEGDEIGLDLLLENPPAGDYELRVVISDEAGNLAEDTVAFAILAEGSELPDDEDEPAADDDESGGCRVNGRGRQRWALLAVLGLAWPRRRTTRP